MPAKSDDGPPARDSNSTPPRPAEHYDRCVHFPPLCGHVLRLLRIQAGYSREGLAAATSLADEELCDVEGGLTLPHTGVLGRLARALGLSFDTLDAHLRRVLEALEARGTWIFLYHPHDLPPAGRLRTRPSANVSWSSLPVLVSGSWLRKEVEAAFHQTPFPPRTLHEQALAHVGQVEQEDTGCDTERAALALVPAPARVAAAMDAARHASIREYATSFHAGDTTTPGMRLELLNTIGHEQVAHTTHTLVWFDHRPSPAAHVRRVDAEHRTATPPRDLLEIRRGLPMGTRAPSADHLVDLMARLARAAANRDDSP